MRECHRHEPARHPGPRGAQATPRTASPGARKAIVFGSVARGDADEWSDLDLVIVADTPRPFLDRYRDFEGMYDVWRRLDLLVYTPAEFAEMQGQGRPFIEHVLREGVVVHEAEPSC